MIGIEFLHEQGPERSASPCGSSGWPSASGSIETISLRRRGSRQRRQKQRIDSLSRLEEWIIATAERRASAISQFCQQRPVQERQPLNN